MAIISLKQTVIIERPGALNDWGEVIVEPTVRTLKARVDEGSTLVRNRQGEEVVATAQILLDKLADVQYDDTISYTDELGRTLREKPIKIAPIRMANGKATLTEVYL